MQLNHDAGKYSPFSQPDNLKHGVAEGLDYKANPFQKNEVNSGNLAIIIRKLLEKNHHDLNFHSCNSGGVPLSTPPLAPLKQNNFQS